MKVKLCNVPFFDMGYNNVGHWTSSNNRTKYFDDLKVKLPKNPLDLNIKYDGSIPSVTVPHNIRDLILVDYIIIDDTKKDYYYFVTEKTMVNEENTKLYLKLDVWTTYFYDYHYQNTFIERCHVPRWNGDKPTVNILDEGLDYGEVIQIEQPQVIKKLNETIVITSSTPLGVPKVSRPTLPPGGGGEDGNGETGGSGSSASGNWQQGILSSKGFRFIKGFEGFAPRKYKDSGGYLTIAYGVTAHGESSIYNSLVAKEPVQEEDGAKVSYDLKNKNYGSKIINACKTLGVTKQYQFDALCSLAYNCGYGVVTGNNTLTRAIKEDITNVAKIKSTWEKFYITSNGQQLAGLVARRKEEVKMFFNESYEVRKISTIDSNGSINGSISGDGWLPKDSESNGDLNGYKSFDNEFGKNWLCPVKGATVTSVYGYRIHPITGENKLHHGTDMGCPSGTPTVASKDGTITQTGYDSSMGNYIYLDSGGYRIRYMHLSKITVSKGDKVKRGDKVGEIGTTGSSTGNHSHWEIRRLSDNKSTNPAPTLKKGNKV